MPARAAGRAGVRKNALPGIRFSDNFDRFADNTLLAGQTTQTGGATWSAAGDPNGAGKVVAGKVTASVTGNSFTSLCNHGADAQKVTLDYTHATGCGVNIILRANNPFNSGYVLGYNPAGPEAYVQIAGTGTFPLDTLTGVPSVAVGGTIHLEGSISASGVITFKIGGATFTATDNSVIGSTRRWAGFQLSSNGAGSVDNVVAS